MGAGGLDRGVGQLVGEGHQVGDAESCSGRSSGTTAARASSAAQAQVGNHASSKTSPSCGRQRRDRAAALPVPRLDLDGPGGDVEVDGDRGRGQQPDGAEQALLDDAVVGTAHQQAAPGQRRGRVVQAGERLGVRRLLGGAAAAAEPVVEAAVAGSAGSAGRRGAGRRSARSAANRSSGRVRATRRGSPSSRSWRRRCGRAEVDGGHVSSRAARGRASPCGPPVGARSRTGCGRGRWPRTRRTRWPRTGAAPR